MGTLTQSIFDNFVSLEKGRKKYLKILQKKEVGDKRWVEEGAKQN